jgi:hypothetical protein
MSIRGLHGKKSLKLLETSNRQSPTKTLNKKITNQNTQQKPKTTTTLNLKSKPYSTISAHGGS